MSAFLWGGARGANSGKRRCAGRETGVGEKMCTQKVKMAHTHARVHTNTVHATKRCVRASGEPRAAPESTGKNMRYAEMRKMCQAKTMSGRREDASRPDRLTTGAAS